MNVLFIVDGSLSNPILFSQGIPHIQENYSKGIDYSILSFENSKFLSHGSTIGDRYFQAMKELEGVAKVYPIILNLEKNSFQRKLRYFLSLFLGVATGIRIIKKNNIKTIHCRSNQPTLIGLLIKLFINVKVLFDDRGLVSDEIPSNRYFRIFLEKRLEYLLYKYSDAIVVVSIAFKDYLISTYKILKKLDKKITVIENSFSEKRFQYSVAMRENQLEKNNLKNRYIMIFSGPSVNWQRFDLVLETFKILKIIKPESYLLIISYDPLIYQMVLTSGISEQDYSIHNLSASDMNKYLIMGDFGVLFGDKRILRRVSAPIKFGEYLASGLPVLLMDEIGDTAEITRKYNSGVIIKDEKELFEKGINEIIELSSQPDIKERCRKAAEQELSLKFSAQKYYSIYKQLNG
ncbi:MAG: glycosyltransferase [Ignavibacteriaceae bacterium]|nr:glycosyltransferase [Ignavibacteriaceae bacterium]